MRKFALVALLLCVSLGAQADVFRPAYLELREIAQSGKPVERYDVMWKVPVMGDSRLAVYIRFPEGTTQLTPPQGVLSQNAYVERWQISRAGGLAGQTLSIDGIAGGVTDVIVRVERSDGSSQVDRVLPDAPQFTVKGATGTGEVAWSYLVLGVEHILGGVELDAADSGDEVWVAKGPYRPTVRQDSLDPRSKTFVLVAGVGFYGGFVGTETQRNQRDWIANKTVLSCDLGDDDPLITDPPDMLAHADRDENCYHVIVAVGGADTILDGFVVTAGQADDPDGFSSKAWAGGLYSDEDASPTVVHCLFTFNVAFAEGGALLNRGAISVTNSRFSYNYTAFDGGAVFSGSHAGAAEVAPNGRDTAAS